MQLKVDKFSEEIYKAADEWDTAMAANQQVHGEKEKLLRIYSSGAVLYGVKYG